MNRRTTNIYRQAKKLGVCPLFKGTENEDRLIRLFLTAQGTEFCIDNNFPDLDTLRTFKTAEQYNIYIDKKVELNNIRKVVLIGSTNATLCYDDPDKRHEVILMHGAKAKIKASGYAVVFVTNSGGIVEKIISDKALIL